MRLAHDRNHRRGITLIELVVATGLMVLLGGLMLTAWSAFGKPAANVIARSRLAREISLTTAAFGDDFGGGLHTSSGITGSKAAGQLVGWLAPNSVEIWLCFDGGSTPNGVADWSSPDTVVSYSLDSGTLTRWDQTANVTTVVARDVGSMTVTLLTDRIHIDITFQYRDVSRSISFEALKP